ncbi:LAFA_0D01046g1_1 [Lachancea sp. 'fantastica']|nr:LAFA_0D01046g1_1 [Lachancea sp. 'fantastica']
MIFARFWQSLRLVCALLVAIHFSASILGTQSIDLCSTPILGQTQWVEQSVCPWWSTHVEPHRREFARPLALQWQIKEEALKCRVESASQMLTTAGKAHVLPFINKWQQVARIKSQLYYNVYVLPHVKHANYEFQLWLRSDGAVARYTAHTIKCISSLFHQVMAQVGRLWKLSHPYLSSEAKCVKARLFKMAACLKKHRLLVQERVSRHLNATDRSVETSKDVPYYESENADDEEQDEFDDDETLYLTSTIIETVTISDNEVATPSSTANSDTDLEVPLRDLVQDEFQAWSNTVAQKALNSEGQLDQDIEEIKTGKLNDIRPRITALLREISNATQQHYRAINKAILDVNCTAEVDPKTGESLFFNREGTQLRNYVTRPLMREYFSQAHAYVDDALERVRDMLEIFVGDVNTDLDQLRQEHLEVYEEWGDVMVSEWSKRMAYVDVVAAMESEDLSQRQHDNWKQFLRLKKQVIFTRDALMRHPADLQDVEKFLKEIQFTLKAIQREAGEYLFILRSKANLAFQAREDLEKQKLLEQMERERREQEELERQEREERLRREQEDLEKFQDMYDSLDEESREIDDDEENAQLLEHEKAQRAALEKLESEQREIMAREQRQDEESHLSE